MIEDVPALVIGAGPAGLMAGYQASSEEPVQAPQGAFYRTGDVASRDADGYLTYHGRADDVIVTGGENVASVEVEKVLDSHPDVVESGGGAGTPAPASASPSSSPSSYSLPLYS